MTNFGKIRRILAVTILADKVCMTTVEWTFDKSSNSTF